MRCDPIGSLTVIRNQHRAASASSGRLQFEVHAAVAELTAHALEKIAAAAVQSPETALV
jgi:hypothetical protein